jgi:hypothetical protein
MISQMTTLGRNQNLHMHRKHMRLILETLSPAIASMLAQGMGRLPSPLPITPGMIVFPTIPLFVNFIDGGNLSFRRFLAVLPVCLAFEFVKFFKVLVLSSGFGITATSLCAEIVTK